MDEIFTRFQRMNAPQRPVGLEGEQVVNSRLLLGLTQTELGDRLGIKQQSVHKIERQGDVQLSTLRRFVEAAGGSLELIIRLPDTGPIRLVGLGSVGATEGG